jgi:preprotein translocase subunit YajC
MISAAPAHAQEQAQGGGPQEAVPFFANPLFMMIIIFGIIYFLIMRPQQKKQKEHQELLRNLAKGDRVMTMSGIYGTVANLDEKIVLLQVDDKVRIKVSRNSVSSITEEDIKV